MKILFSEHNKDYTSYTFDYAVYAVMDSIPELPSIYEQGFLPYSNDLNEKREIFYLSRSLRVELGNFEDSSENRRVNRKLEDLSISIDCEEVSNFDLNNKDFRELCISCAEERFSGNALDEKRFDYLLERKILTHIFTFYNKEGKAEGYVLSMIEGNSLHYWFAFFNTAYLQKYPFGKWMMWKVISWAKEKGLEYAYLGTCYGEKALYKARDFKSLSYFDGFEWNKDLKRLKSWCKSDDDKMELDRFKAGHYALSSL